MDYGIFVHALPKTPADFVLTIERGCTELLGYSQLTKDSCWSLRFNCHCLQFSFHLKSWYWKLKNSTLSDFASTALALNPHQKSSFIFNNQVFVLSVMFTTEIWSFRNKTLSLHSKSYPVVINPSSKLPQKIHDWSIVVNNQLLTSTTKSLLRQY